MARKKKISEDNQFNYSKDKSFENLEAVQQMALNKKGKDDEVTPDISIFLKAEELKGKLCGLYNDKEKTTAKISFMGSVIINGEMLELNVGEKTDTEFNDDSIT